MSNSDKLKTADEEFEIKRLQDLESGVESSNHKLHLAKAEMEAAKVKLAKAKEAAEKAKKDLLADVNRQTEFQLGLVNSTSAGKEHDKNVDNNLRTSTKKEQMK